MGKQGGFKTNALHADRMDFWNILLQFWLKHGVLQRIIGLQPLRLVGWLFLFAASIDGKW